MLKIGIYPYYPYKENVTFIVTATVSNTVKSLVGMNSDTQIPVKREETATMGDIMNLLHGLVATINGLAQVKVQEKLKESIPELEKWDRRQAKQWIKRAKLWCDLYAAPEQILYAHIQLACSHDDEVTMLIKATQNSGLANTFSVLEKAYGDGLEGEKVLRKILEFKIKPGSLAMNWIHFKALIERANQLEVNPGYPLVTKIFIKSLQRSQYKSLAQSIKFANEEAELTWQTVMKTMDRIYLIWEEKEMEDKQNLVPTSPLGRKENNKKICYRCQQEGHIRAHCPTKKVNTTKAIVDTGAQVNVISKSL